MTRSRNIGRGGRRRGAGRKPSALPSRMFTLDLPEAAEAEIVDAIGDTPLGPYLVQAALEKVRRTSKEM